MPTAPSCRPQTLKQAKKAFRKSGVTVRLSESELALIERRAVLEERADRFREREARRKANLKRKEERNQREREARQRMGIPSPTKGGFHVGPSQLHLGDYMAMGIKRKREESLILDGKIENEYLVGTESSHCQAATAEPPPLRTPLQLISRNLVVQEEPRISTEAPKMPSHDVQITQEDPPQPHSTKPTKTQKPFARPEAPKVGDDTKKSAGGIKISPICPPPLPNHVKPKPAPSSTQQKPPLLAPQDRPPDNSNDCWDNFFVSNTQIVRELSPPATKTAPSPNASLKTPLEPLLPMKDDTTSLLSLLNTQDLEFSDILTQVLPQLLRIPTKPGEDTNTSTLLTQISTQDLDFCDEPTQAQDEPEQRRTGDSDFGEDLTEEDLEDLVLGYKIQLSRGSRDLYYKEAKVQEHEDEIKEEYEAFEFSTQDLRELAS